MGLWHRIVSWIHAKPARCTTWAPEKQKCIARHCVSKASAVVKYGKICPTRGGSRVELYLYEPEWNTERRMAAFTWPDLDGAKAHVNKWIGV